MSAPALVALPPVGLSGDELAGVLLVWADLVVLPEERNEVDVRVRAHAAAVSDAVAYLVAQHGVLEARALGGRWAGGPSGWLVPGGPPWEELHGRAVWARETVRVVFGLEASAWPAPAVSRVRDFDYAGAYLGRGARHVWDDGYASGVLGGGA